MSRRTFLQVAAASGVAVATLSSGSLGAVAPPRTPVPRAFAQVGSDRIADLAAALAWDVDEIYRFVRDEIRYQPYVGLLRGAEGTLAARAGNSVDQSVLLAALLDAALIPYRFAVAPLDAAAADRLLESAISDAETLEREALAGMSGSLPGLPEPPTPEIDADLRAAIAEAEARADEIIAWSRAQVQTALDDIGRALDAAGARLPDAFSAMPQMETDSHTWVQAARGTEWVDLDPSLPAGAASQPVPVETLASVPDDWRHAIEFRVVDEQLAGDSVSVRSLMDVTFWADSLAGLPITFLNADPQAVEQFAAAITPVGGERSFVPTLVVGEEGFAGEPIHFGVSGALETDLLSDGSLLGGQGPSGETTAQWLETTILSPGQEPRRARRAIFDRYGPAARAAGGLGEKAPLPVTPITLEDGSEEILEALGSLWLTASVGPPTTDAPVLRQAESDLGAEAILAHAQHVYRELGDLAVGVELGVRSFVDRPNLVSFFTQGRGGQDGNERILAGLDIWHRGRAVVPVAGVAAPASPAAVAGILDHVVERLLGGEADPDTLPESVFRPASVGRLFDLAREAGVATRLVAGEADIDALHYPADARSLLAERVADGWLAVAPREGLTLEGESRAGWWLVHPETGEVIDQLDDGRGPEYIIVHAPGQISKSALRQMAYKCLIAGANLASVAILMLAPPATGARGYAKSALTAANGIFGGTFLALCLRGP